MTSSVAICLLDAPRASRTSTSISRAVRPATALLRRATRWPAASRTASTASPSRRPARTSAASSAAASAGWPGWPVRPRLAHRLVGLRRAEHPGQPGDRAAGKPARVPAAVEALPQLHRDLAERRQRSRLPQHALGQVGRHPDPLPVAGAQRPRLVQDRVRHAEPAVAVDKAGPAQQVCLLRRQAEPAPGRFGQLRDRDRVAERERRFQVDEVADGRQRAVQFSRRQFDGKRRLGRDHRLPGGHRVEAVEDRIRLRAQQRRERRVELPARP